MASLNLEELLKGFGLPSKSIDRVRLSRGVVGRTTYAIVAFLAVMAVAFSRASPEWVIWLALLTAIVFVIYFVGVLLFARRYPGVALLEGAELLRWEQTQLAAKGIGPLPPQPPLPAPIPIDALPAPISDTPDPPS